MDWAVRGTGLGDPPEILRSFHQLPSPVGPSSHDEARGLAACEVHKALADLICGMFCQRVRDRSAGVRIERVQGNLLLSGGGFSSTLNYDLDVQIDKVQRLNFS